MKKSLKNLLLKAHQLKTKKHGAKNKTLAMNDWSLSKISDTYIKLMN